MSLHASRKFAWPIGRYGWMPGPWWAGHAHRCELRSIRAFSERDEWRCSPYGGQLARKLHRVAHASFSPRPWSSYSRLWGASASHSIHSQRFARFGPDCWAGFLSTASLSCSHVFCRRKNNDTLSALSLSLTIRLPFFRPSWRRTSFFCIHPGLLAGVLGYALQRSAYMAAFPR